MYVEGRVLSVDGKPISNAVIETWETDGDGMKMTADLTIISNFDFDFVRLLRYPVQRSRAPRLQRPSAFGSQR